MIDLILPKLGHTQNRLPVVALRTAVVKTLRGMLLLMAFLSAGLAVAEEETELRLTVTLVTLDMAQTACGYLINRSRLEALLSSAHVTREQIYSRPLTPALGAALDGLRDRFQQDPTGACAEAWRQYGPPSELGLLAR